MGESSPFDPQFVKLPRCQIQTGTIHMSTDEGRVWAKPWYFDSDLIIICIFPASQGMKALENGKKSSWMSWGQGRNQDTLDQVLQIFRHWNLMYLQN